LIKRTIEISREAAHLTVQQKQLLIKRGDEIVGRIPCEDIGVVLVDHPGATYSHAALAALAECDAALVVCGRNHLPSAVLLPLSDHSQVIWRINDQLGVSKPLQKQLWKQLVRAKIRAQAVNLPSDCPARSKLLDMARQVRSGDPKNVEAQAARVYWAHYLSQETFRRDAEADGLNSFLNYGYAVVRAAVARALVAAGLFPALGLHHANRSNAFCLADDVIEPLRPLVDDRARELYLQGHRELIPETKAGLLRLLADPVQMTGETGPLMVNLHRLAASLVRCYAGESKTLDIPTALVAQDSSVTNADDADDADDDDITHEALSQNADSTQ
jgi:CRISPR-associated protein Cas1